jgi:hypothetical protein
MNLFATLYTAEDVEETARDLAFLIEQHAEETDPEARAMLADWIESDTAWLAEMREAVYPTLRLMLPLGLPAPGPRWEMGR